VTEADAAGALADRIAARGREALVDRLRKAYLDAAAAHADIVTLDQDRIEAMVQAAADRADGLQWRRALASVAADELGVNLAQALSHPAVTRAQELVGAPSYEASLAELIARPIPPATPVSVAAPEESVPEQIPGQEELFPVGEPAGQPESPALPEPAHSPGPAHAAEPAASPQSTPIASADTLEAVQVDDQVVQLLPEPDVDDLDDGYVLEEEPPLPPRQPERVLEEPELHGATGELEAIEADDAIFELMPPPEPTDYEVGSYEGEPEPLTTEEAAPPVLEQVPYVPDDDEDELLPALDPEPVAVEEPAPSGPEPIAAPGYEPPADEADIGQPADSQGHGDLYDPSPTEAYQLEDELVAYGSEHTEYTAADLPGNDELRVTAYHLGGVANLPASRNGLDLRLSVNGLDILQPEGDIIGRLHWNEIDALEVQAVRGRLRRSTRTQSRVVVRTRHGDASFEVPGFTSDELEARVEPLVSRFSSQA